MTRVRTDNVFGTLTDNPLTNSATTMNSAGLANLAAVSSAEAIIILDPNRVSGAPEIVVVTAHTGSATSATIVRGQFGTSAREHAQGTEWVHGPIASNATSYATAADDQGDYVPMNAWESYTPSNTNVTVGNGTQVAAFIRIGRTVHFRYRLTFGSTTSFSAAPRIGLPVTPAILTTDHETFGVATIIDAGTRVFTGTCYQGAGTAHATPTHSESGNFGIVDATNPMTWTTGDVLILKGTYEAAS